MQPTLLAIGPDYTKLTGDSLVIIRGGGPLGEHRLQVVGMYMGLPPETKALFKGEVCDGAAVRVDIGACSVGIGLEDTDWRALTERAEARLAIAQRLFSLFPRTREPVQHL